MNESQEFMSAVEMQPTSTEVAVEQERKLEPGLEFDTRFKDIRSELVSEWTRSAGRVITSAEGQNFLYGDPSDYIQGGKPTPLEDKVKEVFADRFPEDAKDYEKLEKVRVYDNPTDDPAMKKVDDDILIRTNRDSMNGTDWHTNLRRVEMQTWDSFLIRYPEKAAEYAKYSEPVKEALGRAERRAAREQAEISRRQAQLEKKDVIPELEEDSGITESTDLKVETISNSIASAGSESEVAHSGLPRTNLETREFEDLEPEDNYAESDSEEFLTTASPIEVSFAQKIDDQVKIDQIRQQLTGKTQSVSEWQMFSILSSVNKKRRFTIDHGTAEQQTFEVIPGKQECIVAVIDARGQHTRWKVSQTGQVEIVSTSTEQNQLAQDSLRVLMKKFLGEINSKKAE